MSPSSLEPLEPLKPLEGFAVGITADRRWEEQAELLQRRGATVFHGPTIATQYLASDDDLRRATDAVLADPPDYVVATTGIGMRAWLEAAAVWGLGEELASTLGRARIVARGPKAASAVQAVGCEVWARPAREQMSAVVERLLEEPLAGRRVAVQEYGMVCPDTSDALRAAGAVVLDVPVYRWKVPVDRGPALRLVEAACEGKLDALTFTSAPAVHNLFAIAAGNGLDGDLRRACNGDVAVACVGPVCAEGAREEGVDSPLVPSLGRMGLLVRALSDHLASRRMVLQLGATEVVIQGSVVTVGANRADLAPRERAVMEALLAARGAVVARTTLLQRVWGSPAADPHVLEVTVGRLRRRLGPAAVALVASPGRGYRLDLDPALAGQSPGSSRN